MSTSRPLSLQRTVEEYMKESEAIRGHESEIYRYMFFDKMEGYKD